MHFLFLQNIFTQNLKPEHVTAYNGRDYNESSSEIWKDNTRLHDEIFSKSSNMTYMCVLHSVLWKKKKKKRGRWKWTFTECSLYNFLIVHESRPELARKSNRKLLYSLVLSQFSSYISPFHRLSSLCLFRTDLKRVIGLHGDARDKRKEGRRDVAV